MGDITGRSGRGLKRRGHGAVRTLALGSTALALAAAAPAVAQQTTNPPPAGGAVETQEVVVTATRRAESLSKVPASVSAVTERTADLQGLKELSDIVRVTPGIQLDPIGFGNVSNIAIRGVSSGTGAATTGIYIDDTPIQARAVGYTSTNTYPLVFDLDRVEVLRGPQGTLFGAGSEGGAVRFITPQPSLTDFSTYGRAELSGTQGGTVNGEFGLAEGGPIVADKLGFRVSAWYRRDGGYIDRESDTGAGVEKTSNANSADTFVGRVAFVLQPMPGLKITPSLFYQNHRVNDSSAFWQGASAPSSDKYVNRQPLAQPDHDSFVLPALNVQYDVSGLRFISNTSLFQNREASVIDYSTYLPAIFGIPPFVLPGFTAQTQNSNRQEVFTEEARLQSIASGRLNWTVGVFYSQSRQRSYETVVSPGFGAIPALLTGGFLNTAQFFGLPLVNGQDALVGTAQGIDQQEAVFGDLDFNLTDKLKLTAGVRVAQTKFTGSSVYTGPFVGTTAIQDPGTKTEHPITPKFGIDYQLDRDNLIYASASKGYRIGGVNAPVGGPCTASLAADGFSEVPPTYASDSLWSYEVGAKNRLFDRKLEVATSAYHIDWSNIQQLVVLPCGAEFDANLGKAVSNGFDLQFSYRPVAGLTVDGTAGYTDAHITQSIVAAGGDLVTAGDHLETHPWTATLGATYEHALWDEVPGYARIDYEYRSEGLRTVLTDPTTTSYDPALPMTASTSFLSLRLGARLKGVDVSFFVDNLTDAHPALVNADEVRNGPAIGDPLRTITFRPRTVGVTVVYRQ